MREYTFIYMSDDGFVMPTVVSITSLVKHKSANAHYKIYLLLDEVSSYEKKHLDALNYEGVDIYRYDVDCKEFSETANVGEWKSIYVSRTDMFKFELPQYLDNVDKALYIDGDTIINKCVEPLFEIDIEDNYLASVDDMGDSYDPDGNSMSFKRIGISGRHYFNAGIMYLNLKNMREDSISREIWDYRLNGINYFMSQDALNYVMRRKRVILPYRFNFLTCALDYYSFSDVNELFCEKKYESVEECIADQVILHMAGELKPWKYKMPWITDVFMEYYMNSPYKDEGLSLQSPIHRVIDNQKRNDRNNLWRIFELNVAKGERVVLYGAGFVGRNLFEYNKNEDYSKIVMWADKNAKKIDCIYGVEIHLPDEIISSHCKFDRIVIANSSPQIANEIRRELSNIGIDISKCITIG